VVSIVLPTGLDLPKLRRSLNALTPPGIAVLELRPAPAAFDARKDAISRSYRYFLSTQPVISPFWTRYCWQIHGGVDASLLRTAAALVAGRHDFTAFTPTETEHVFFERTVLRCRWTQVRATLPLSPVAPAPTVRSAARAGAILCLEIEADAFLRHMVRSLVGTMVELAQGERSVGDFRQLLDGASREAAGPTAPAHGLFLWDIRYGRSPAARRGPRPERDPAASTSAG
jgi:tRNA pseudouridine38-40 synthase